MKNLWHPQNLSKRFFIVGKRFFRFLKCSSHWEWFLYERLYGEAKIIILWHHCKTLPCCTFICSTLKWVRTENKIQMTTNCFNLPITGSSDAALSFSYTIRHRIVDPWLYNIRFSLAAVTVCFWSTVAIAKVVRRQADQMVMITCWWFNHHVLSWFTDLI